MLILTRKPGEAIVIDGHILVTVVAFRGGAVRLGIDAPPDVTVNRKEVQDALPASLRRETDTEDGEAGMEGGER